eukprot:gene2122-3063_t
MFGLITVAAAGAAFVSPTPIALPPSDEFSVLIDGEPAFVYMGTVDGAAVHNGSFVYIALTQGGTPRHVQVTPTGGRTATPATLRPPPVGGPALPAVAVDGGRWGFSVDRPFSAAYQLASFSSGLMVFAHYTDPHPPAKDDPSVVYFGPG